MHRFDVSANAHCSAMNCHSSMMCWNCCYWLCPDCLHSIDNWRCQKRQHFLAIRPAEELNRFRCGGDNGIWLIWLQAREVFFVNFPYLNALVLKNVLRSCRAALAFFTLCLICSNVDWWNRYAAQSGEHCDTPKPSSDFIYKKKFVWNFAPQCVLKFKIIGCGENRFIHTKVTMDKTSQSTYYYYGLKHTYVWCQIWFLLEFSRILKRIYSSK